MSLYYFFRKQFLTVITKKVFSLYSPIEYIFYCDQCPKSFSASNDLEKCRKNVTGDKQISQILPISNVLIITSAQSHFYQALI